jgi:hypothetical protein
MTEPADAISGVLQAYAAKHDLPPHTLFVLYSPNCILPPSELGRHIAALGSVPVAIDGIPDDELWLTDASLDHASVTKIG